jgi:hypothetical protein
MAEIQASSTVEKVGTVSKEKKGKLRTSAYMLTINTNQPVKDIEAVGEGKVSVFNLAANNPKFKPTFDKFIAALEAVFAGQNIKKFIEIKEPGANFSRKYFEKIDVKTVPEVGMEKSNLHAQSVLLIKHRTRVGIKINEMREAFAEKMGIPAENVWFRYKLLDKNPTDMAEMYIFKDV